MKYSESYKPSEIKACLKAGIRNRGYRSEDVLVGVLEDTLGLINSLEESLGDYRENLIDLEDRLDGLEAEIGFLDADGAP